VFIVPLSATSFATPASPGAAETEVARQELEPLDGPEEILRHHDRLEVKRRSARLAFAIFSK
jgi:hypothetical protein